MFGHGVQLRFHFVKPLRKYLIRFAHVADYGKHNGHEQEHENAPAQEDRRHHEVRHAGYAYDEIAYKEKHKQQKRRCEQHIAAAFVFQIHARFKEQKVAYDVIHHKRAARIY